MLSLRNFLLYAMTILAANMFLSPVQAQEAAGIKIQPAIIEEKIDPGQTFNLILRATNLSGEQKTFYILKKDISRLSESGFPVFAGEGEKTGFEISSWIQVSSKPIVIRGGATREIPFSIVVPENATPGGHFGGIFVSLTPELPKESGIGIGYQVGTIINLRIAGEIFEEAQIREFRTDKNIYSKPEVNFLVKVENLGNVLLRPRGPLEIVDFFGKKSATLVMNESGSAVLPKSVRQFEAGWEGEGLALGRYQAILSLNYGEEGVKTISRVISFWVLPLNIILPVFGILLGIILAIIFFVRAHIKKQVAQILKNTENPVHPNLLHRRKSPISRLALITLVMLVFVLLFLTVLFFLFA